MSRPAYLLEDVVEVPLCAAERVLPRHVGGDDLQQEEHVAQEAVALVVARVLALRHSPVRRAERRGTAGMPSAGAGHRRPDASSGARCQACPLQRAQMRTGRSSRAVAGAAHPTESTPRGPRAVPVSLPMSVKPARAPKRRAPSGEEITCPTRLRKCAAEGKLISRVSAPRSSRLASKHPPLAVPPFEIQAQRVLVVLWQPL